jgi:cobyrinic acid a,c-diamide synthase
MNIKAPSIIIAGLSGGAGKTLCTMGIIAALKKRGLRVAPFKKGPDFIDSMWLSRTAYVHCRNLDVFLMGEKQTRDSFLSHAHNADVYVIEGNRGLFDGFDKKGSYSTANLAKLIHSNVFLITIPR